MESETIFTFLCLASVILAISGNTSETCLVYLNADGETEQVSMKITYATDSPTSADFSPLTHAPCIQAFTVHLIILPSDISGLSETPSRLQIYSVFQNTTYLMSHVRSVDISSFKLFRQINCWLGIPVFRPVLDQVIIHVVVKVTGKDVREQKFIGDKLIIPSSDANTCVGPCQDNDIDFKTSYACLSNSTLTHAPHVHILRVTFTSLSLSGNTSSLDIHRQGDQHTTVYFANIYDGVGRMELTYTVSEFYCSIHTFVRLFCNPALTTTSQKPDPKVHSFGTFVIFGLVTMLVFTVIIILIIFIVQKFNLLRQFSCNGKDKSKQDRHQHRSALLSTNTEHVMKKTALRKIGEIHELQSLVNNGTPEVQRKGMLTRTQSTSQSNSSVQQGLRYDYDKPVCGRKLQRSVTQALLQTMGPTSTSILLLPLPFDQFTRDIVELLGTVLIMEADIPTRYCFDRDVQTEYFRDANAYISEVCSDKNKLLIFVCMTNLANLSTNKSEEPLSLMHDLLRAIDVQHIEPMCKIVFLHLTDDDNALQNKYHGLDIHIKQENYFERFLALVLKECGKISEENNLLNKMVTCEASEYFVEYIKEDHA